MITSAPESELSRTHFVRVGVLAHVGRFTSVDAVAYPRGTRVICRTSRGLEVGQVLGPAGEIDRETQSDGSVVRRILPEDDLILTRLEKNRHEAYDACARLLAEHAIDVILMDVEHLFDGQSLYFYFLGDVPDHVEALTGQLAEAYEAKAQFRAFTEAMEQGCGPDCGTENAAGCGDSCATCAVASACKKPT